MPDIPAGIVRSAMAYGWWVRRLEKECFHQKTHRGRFCIMLSDKKQAKALKYESTSFSYRCIMFSSVLIQTLVSFTNQIMCTHVSLKGKKVMYLIKNSGFKSLSNFLPFFWNGDLNPGFSKIFAPNLNYWRWWHQIQARKFNFLDFMSCPKTAAI